MTPQNYLNKGNLKPTSSWPSQELPCKVVLSIGEGPGPGPWDTGGNHQGSKPLSQEDMLRPWTLQQASMSQQNEKNLSSAKSVMQHHHGEPTMHLVPGTHPPPFHPAIEEPSSFSFRGPSRGHNMRCSSIAQSIAYEAGLPAQT